jgi:hemoglobin-like flavoprotein
VTPRQIHLVQSSFDKVLAIRDLAAEVFYQRLFELDPSLRPMFKGDMREQGEKLMQTLQLVVVNLRHPERFLPGVLGLADRHVGYGVKNEHYATVGTALLDTLRIGLGAQFDDEMGEAWLAAYTMLSKLMIAAADELRHSMTS